MYNNNIFAIVQLLFMTLLFQRPKSGVHESTTGNKHRNCFYYFSTQDANTNVKSVSVFRVLFPVVYIGVDFNVYFEEG